MSDHEFSETLSDSKRERELQSEPPVRSGELVSLREKAEASLHHWQRIREDSSRVDHRQNCDFQICWLRGYMRALDDIAGKQANSETELVRDSEPRYSKMELIRAVNACCTCGGGGTGEKHTCPACEVYHALATVPNTPTEPCQ